MALQFKGAPVQNVLFKGIQVQTLQFNGHTVWENHKWSEWNSFIIHDNGKDPNLWGFSDNPLVGPFDYHPTLSLDGVTYSPYKFLYQSDSRHASRSQFYMKRSGGYIQAVPYIELEYKIDGGGGPWNVRLRNQSTGTTDPFGEYVPMDGDTFVNLRQNVGRVCRFRVREIRV